MLHENRERELGYKALMRAEEEQALHDRRALGERGRRTRTDRGAAGGGRDQGLTERERSMRWPVD